MGVNLASFYDGGRHGYINGDTGAFSGENYPNNPITTGFMPVTAGAEYSISMTNDEKMGAMWVAWLFYDSEKEPTGNRMAVTAGSVGSWSQTVTAPEGAAYMRVSYRLRDGVKLKVEEGQPTEWTPNPTDRERQQAIGSVHPMFAADYDSEWWNGASALYQRLDDGWVRLYEDRTGETGWGGNRNALPSLSPHVVDDGEFHMHTILVEIADNNSSGNIQWYDIYSNAANQLNKITLNKNLGNLEDWGDGIHRLAVPTREAGDYTQLLNIRYRVGADSKVDLKMRVSVYPGLYLGGYMPYREKSVTRRMPRVMLFDRQDRPLGELSEDEVFALVLKEEINGEHRLDITTPCVLEKGWRVLTCDARGRWREHVVYGTDAEHDSGARPFGTYHCVWSLQHDLMGTRVSRMPGVQTPVRASVALGYAIEGTARWALGTVTNTNTGGASMYDTDGWSALGTLVEVWGGEVDATIEVGSSGVVSRKVDLYSAQGEQTARRRFDFARDLSSVRRKVEDGPMYCRITPRGKGEATDTGGYGRKITIESVNGGKDYLENAAMVDLAKLPDGNGGWEYPTLEVENSQMETPAELKVWAQGILEESTVPKVTYDVDVLQVGREGVDMQGVSLGDAVQIVDKKFGEGVRVSGRVTEMVTNLLDERDTRLTIGQIGHGLEGMMRSLGGQVNTLTSVVQTMNGGTFSTAEYLSRLVERLNDEINATGGYTYITEGQGLRTYDKAVSDPLVGSEASAVVEIKGGTIRIANTKTAQGEWEWKTVFTSGHVAADLVTAGHITAGYIGSLSGNYWNLDDGTLNTYNMNATNINANGEFVTEGTDKITYNLIDYYLKTRITSGKVGIYNRRNGTTEWVKAGELNSRIVAKYDSSSKTTKYMRGIGLVGTEDFYLDVENTSSDYAPLVCSESAYKTLKMQTSPRDSVILGPNSSSKLCSSTKACLEARAVTTEQGYTVIIPKPVEISGSTVTIDILKKTGTGSSSVLTHKKYEFTFTSKP